jgi:hypothetical protein
MSQRYSLNKEDLKKIGIGALMAIAGALLTYVTETISQVDFKEYTPLVVAIWSIIANVARKYIAESE